MIEKLACAVSNSSREMKGSLDSGGWMSSSISSRELREVSGDDIAEGIFFSLLQQKRAESFLLGASKTNSLALRMLILAYLAPKVEHNDALGNPISSSIDQYLIQDELLRHRCGLGVYDLDVAVVILFGLGDVDGRDILLRDPPFRLLHAPSAAQEFLSEAYGT
jgi:hypothetical protein